jgi:phospho-N-acetylmuramoyl-pentapeptide-transferase
MIKTIVISFLINFILTKIIIKSSSGLVNPIRKFTPQTSILKPKTSPFGGICIFISTLLVSLFTSNLNNAILLVPTVIIFILGLYDDANKLFSNSQHGITAKQKFFIQGVAGIVMCYLIFKFNLNFNTFNIIIPFYSIITITLPKFIAFLIIFFAFIGTINAVNLTDGLDGLAGKQSLLIFIFIAFFIIYTNSNIENLNSLVFIIIGALIAFLIFNSNPASIIMGDAGSMGIGALIATFFILLKIELIMPIICLIFFVEALSVIIQVIYFKITKGKRIFKMSPIHHHFQLTGIKEQKIVEIAFFITLILIILFISPFYV